VAGTPRLSPGAGKRLLALSALVLLLHALALDWLALHLEDPAMLRPLPPPMFTRLLTPEAPFAPPPPPPPAPRVRPSRPAVTSIASEPVAAPKAAASAPAPVAAAEEPSQAASSPAIAAAEPAQPPASSPAQSEVAASSPPATTETAAVPQVAASAAAPGNALEGWPVDTRLNYRLGGLFRNGELHGTARVQWQRQEGRYQTRVEIDLTLLASLVLTSQGEVTPQGLKPQAYEELRRSGPRGAKFGDATIALSNGRTVPKPDGVQDTASQFVELSHRFSSGQDVLEVGRSVSLWMARPGAVDLWTYDIVGREMLKTPRLGEVEAFHLKPRPIANPRGNITAEMWFAPSLQYLPVRIRVNMGEDNHVDLMVDHIEQR
jgi:hypothetical protein